MGNGKYTRVIRKAKGENPAPDHWRRELLG
jgi:hypothetical protein